MAEQRHEQDEMEMEHVQELEQDPEPEEDQEQALSPDSEPVMAMSAEQVTEVEEPCAVDIGGDADLCVLDEIEATAQDARCDEDAVEGTEQAEAPEAEPSATIEGLVSNPITNEVMEAPASLSDSEEAEDDLPIAALDEVETMDVLGPGQLDEAPADPTDSGEELSTEATSIPTLPVDVSDAAAEPDQDACIQDVNAEQEQDSIVEDVDQPPATNAFKEEKEEQEQEQPQGRASLPALHLELDLPTESEECVQSPGENSAGDYDHDLPDADDPPPSLPPSISLALPPPIPTAAEGRPIMMGSLVPVDSDNDSDDEDKADSENSSPIALGPPLDLHATRDDEEEELEVDTDVQQAILAEQAARKATIAPAPASEPPTSAPTPAFADESTSFQASALPPAMKPRAVDTVDHDEDTFGISYQSMKPKYHVGRHEDPHDLDLVDISLDETALPTLSSTRTLAEPARLASSPPTDEAAGSHADSEDDEFWESSNGASNLDGRVDTLLDARAAAAARMAQEQAEIAQQLMQATRAEKAMLSNPVVSIDSDASAATSNGNGDANPLTIAELHSIYKRGLGDQEVRLMEDDGAAATASTETQQQQQRLSIIGRILSKQPLSTQPIQEEQEGDELEDEDEAGNENENDRTVRDDDQEANESDPGEAEHASIMPAALTTPPAGKSTSADVVRDATGLDEDDEADEWKEIQLQPKGSTVAASSAMAALSSIAKVSYTEARHALMDKDDLFAVRDQIIAEEFSGGAGASCMGCLSRPRLTFTGAMEERDRVFCVAATPFDPRNDVMVRMLQTVYRTVLGSNHGDVSVIGPHWEKIGFQGADPSTDLRGCGMLSVLQMLFVLETDLSLAQRLHAKAQDSMRSFPWACALINVTLQCLRALRSGALYRTCNQRASVLDAMNALYVAAIARLLQELQRDRSTNLPAVLTRVLDIVRLHPERVLADMPSSQRKPGTPAKAAASPTPTNADLDTFELHGLCSDE